VCAEMTDAINDGELYLRVIPKFEMLRMTKVL
jgi:hypothetical protein